MPLRSRSRRFPARVLVLQMMVLAACDSDFTGHGKSPTGALAHVRWVVPSALAATGSLLNFAAASDSVIVVSGAAELVGYAASDGRVLWKRRDVPTRQPLAVDDSRSSRLPRGHRWRCVRGMDSSSGERPYPATRSQRCRYRSVSTH